MWRLLYLFLLIVRVYFALCPSYLHPDEIFQGPEPIAARQTWEWTSSHPIRSVFPLWPIYGLPVALLKWVWAQDEDDLVDPAVIYYTLRLVMLALSFVLEDWAVHDLVRSPRHWRQAVILVTSSYVTWTFQTHTFSNSVETLVVLWSLVVIERILRENVAYYSGPAATRSFGALFDHVRHHPVITPLNNLLYNTQTSNLAEHGLHPHYQHLVANLPQLLGPALVLLLASAYPFNLRVLKATFANNRLASAAVGTLFLSLIPHQELRFLLPNVPLILTSIRVPSSKFWSRIFWASWIIFNTALAILMGIYHQGGIISAQLAIPSLIVQSTNTTHSDAHNIEVFWWKTYPPPTFLLGSEPLHPATNRSLNVSTVPLMGYPQNELVFMLMQHMPTCDPTLIERFFIHKEKTDVYVVAPLSAWRLSPTQGPGQQAYRYPPVSNFSFAIDMNQPPAQLQMTNLAVFRRHVNLDDLDFGDDGVWPTLERVVGRRGLGVWKVDRICGPIQYVDAHTGEKLSLEQVKQREEDLKHSEADTRGKQEESGSPTDQHGDRHVLQETEEPPEPATSSFTAAAKEAVSSFSSTLGEMIEAEEAQGMRVSTTTVPANFSAQEVHVAS
ncbi:GPI mannosyltransferase 4 [Cladophialophora carrionii]|uniref:Mannosyltransferase n=1 Tax=Cladophialophora carrionii TaxID=86049 RepID=A0A1C1CPY0_9EURO|nr:GPI mannosyltransferase 4 [Cladophialophora carrionii]